ncbi:MAG: acyltransferase [Thermoanaerobaculia bacterium]|nr:acyltransferase [Thermoanaerobaculia bacterium]
MRHEPLAPRYHDLDVWRGVACLLVIVFHSTFYVSAATQGAPLTVATALVRVAERCWLGVSIFFVISGYCIAATADRTSRRGLSLDFFRRRLRRIFPPYLICLGLIVVFVAAVEFLRPGLLADAISPQPPPQAYDALQWLGNSTLTEAWRPFAFGSRHPPGHQAFFLGPAWTLAYEEQFYLVVGFALALWPRRFFVVLAILTAANVAAMLARPSLVHDAWGTCLEYAGWLQFAAGVGLYHVTNYGARLARLAYAATAAGLLVFLAVRFPADLLQFRGETEQHGFFAASFALVALALKPKDGSLSSARLLRPLLWCGVRCYSIYLLHWPLGKLISRLAWDLGIQSATATLALTVPAAIVATVGAAALFHRYVERRFLNSPRGEPSSAVSGFAPAG